MKGQIDIGPLKGVLENREAIKKKRIYKDIGLKGNPILICIFNNN